MKPESSVIFFPCKDIEETKAYYTEVLSLPIYKDLGTTVWFDCGYGYLAFVYYGPDRALATGLDFLAIFVSNLNLGTVIGDAAAIHGSNCTGFQINV